MSSKKKNKKIIKAFFDSSNKNNNENLEIISLLNKYNCNVVQTVIGADLNYTIGGSGDKASLNIFSNKVKDIIDCDVFICDISKNTPSLFFLIFEALDRKKPVLALYKDEQELDETWLNQKYDLLKLEKYDNKNLENIISDFLNFAYKRFPTSRFTVRLNDELCDYIDHLKPKLGCSSRNDVILKLLDNTQKEDANFQEAIKKNN